MKQLTFLHSKFDYLQTIFGDSNLKSIYGAGDINSPKIMFIFMNPTGRNVSSNPRWGGIRAPWIGTKQVWDIFSKLKLLNINIYNEIKTKSPIEWDEEFALKVFSNIEENKVYITNLAKCTQIDARPLNNRVFKEYLELMKMEIESVNPQKIVTFGNQVSSILLEKAISVSKYLDSYEFLNLSKIFPVYPTYYPVGQGRRNMPMTIKRLNSICNK